MKILFMGRKQTSAEILEWTLKSGYEVVGVLTDNHLVGSPTTGVANKYGIHIYTLEQVYELIQSDNIEIDLAISVVYWRKIKEPLISFPKFGTINLHPAPLPDYKGTAGYNLAILENLDKWAITSHYVTESIDDGPIIDKFEFSIDSIEETVVTLEAKCQEFIKALYKKTIREVSLKGLLNSVENKGGRYISREEMETMKKISEDDDIDRKLRAFWFPPYTGAFIELNGKKYTLINDYILKTLAKDGTSLIVPEKK